MAPNQEFASTEILKKFSVLEKKVSEAVGFVFIVQKYMEKRKGFQESSQMSFRLACR